MITTGKRQRLRRRETSAVFLETSTACLPCQPLVERRTDHLSNDPCANTRTSGVFGNLLQVDSRVNPSVRWGQVSVGASCPLGRPVRWGVLSVGASCPLGSSVPRGQVSVGSDPAVAPFVRTSVAFTSLRTFLLAVRSTIEKSQLQVGCFVKGHEARRCDIYAT